MFFFTDSNLSLIILIRKKVLSLELLVKVKNTRGALCLNAYVSCFNHHVFCYFRNCAGTQTALTDFENGDCCSGGFDFDLAEMAAEEAFKKSNSSSFSWFRRVLKFALPVQFFVMMMLFLAWVRCFLCFLHVANGFS